ncbi:MAG: phosphatase PAP2 family protein [Methyloligellaceae bacterium]
MSNSSVFKPRLPSPTHGFREIVRNKFFRELRISLKAHGIFLFIAIGFFLAAHLVILPLAGHESAVAADILDIFKMLLLMVVPIVFLSVLINRFLFLAIYVRPQSPTKALYNELKVYFSNRCRLLNAIPMTLAMVLFITAYVGVKAAIPALNPFSWDLTFDAWDRVLHFGARPWELLQPVLGYNFVTFLVSVSYNLWFMVMWMVWCLLAFSEQPTRLRLQFFLSFMVVWLVGGSVLAVAFSSAGPVYFEELGLHPDPYAPLMNHLYEVNETFPIWALATQELLWDGYLGNQTTVVGISAMPSMHNATAVLLALAGWKISRPLGIGLTAFAILILLGSVHLGWHYAIDGYFAIVLALACWWISGFIAKWWENTNWYRSHVQQIEDLGSAQS